MNKLSYEELTKQNLAKYNSTRQTLPGWENKAAYDLALQFALIELHRLACEHSRDDYYDGIQLAIDIVEDVYHGHRREA